MEKILLTYQGQRLVNKELVHLYQEEGCLPMAFTTKIAGQEEIGQRLECYKSGNEITFAHRFMCSIENPHQIALWNQLEEHAVKTFTSFPKTILQKITNKLLPDLKPIKSKVLGKFLILPYNSVTSLLLLNWLANHPHITMNCVLDDVEPEEKFFTIVLSGATELQLNQVSNFINNNI